MIKPHYDYTGAPCAGDNNRPQLKATLKCAVLSHSTTKSIVFGTNHSLISRSQPNLVMNGVAVKVVEEAK